MTESTYDTFPQQLRISVPGFDRVYDEHVLDNDEVLPHVLMGDLVRFLLDDVQVHGAGSPVLRAAMALLESAMGSPDPKLQEVVAVSFLESLDPADPNFLVIRRSFGPWLEEQYRKYQ